MAKLSTPISLSDADDMIRQRNTIKIDCATFIGQAIGLASSTLNQIEADNPTDANFTNYAAKAFNNFADASNAYIFSKEDFMRYFNGDTTGTGGNGQADYIMILVSAHKENIGSYTKGQQAVLIAGCNKDTINPDLYRTLDWTKPADEHVPKKSVTRLPTNMVKDATSIAGGFIEVTLK